MASFAVMCVTISAACITSGMTQAGWAIDVHPSAAEIAAAMARGQAAATTRTPPDRLYSWFGPERAHTEPHGFLMTKLNGLAVMAAHFELRGVRPTDLDRDQILADPALLITVILFGERPDFAVDSYMLLLQKDRRITPVKVRIDGTADRSIVWPHSPRYRAKVIAFFAYADFDPMAKTVLSVFPRSGGEVRFDLDFAATP